MTPEMREKRQQYVEKMKAEYYSQSDRYRGVKVSVWYTYANECGCRGNVYYIQRESDGYILDLLPAENRIGWRREVGFGWRPLADNVGGFGEMVDNSTQWEPMHNIGIR